MTEKEEKKLLADVKRLEKMVNLLSRRVIDLERQNRTTKAKLHQQTLDLAYVKRG